MIHRNSQGTIVEVLRSSFKNDRLYNNHVYQLLCTTSTKTHPQLNSTDNSKKDKKTLKV